MEEIEEIDVNDLFREPKTLSLQSLDKRISLIEEKTHRIEMDLELILKVLRGK